MSVHKDMIVSELFRIIMGIILYDVIFTHSQKLKLSDH